MMISVEMNSSSAYPLFGKPSTTTVVKSCSPPPQPDDVDDTGFVEMADEPQPENDSCYDHGCSSATTAVVVVASTTAADTTTTLENSCITGNSSTTSSDSFNYQQQQQYSPFKQSSCTESRIKDLIESPILNKCLSPRLSHIMRNRSTSDNETFDELAEMGSPEKCRSVNEVEEQQQVESVDVGQDENNVILENSPPLPSASTASPAQSPKPSKSNGLLVSSSPRALAIFNAASRSKKLLAQNSASDSSSDSDSQPKPANTTPNKLKRTLSFQDYFNIRRTSNFPSMHSRGSTLLKAAQQAKAVAAASVQTRDIIVEPVVRTPPLPQPLDSPKSGILRKENTPITKQRRKVIFTEPVVSRQMFFDSNSSTLPEQDTPNQDVSFKKQKLNDNTEVVIIKTVKPETEEEEYKLCTRKAPANFVNLFLNDFDDDANSSCDSEMRSTEPSEESTEDECVTAVENMAKSEFQEEQNESEDICVTEFEDMIAADFAEELRNQSTISDSEGNDSVMIEMDMELSPILRKSSQDSPDDEEVEFDCIEESPMKNQVTESIQSVVEDSSQESSDNQVDTECSSQSSTDSSSQPIVSSSSQIISSPRALSIFKAATKSQPAPVFPCSPVAAPAAKSSLKPTRLSLNNRGSTLLQAAKAKISQKEQLFTPEVKIEVITDDSKQLVTPKSILKNRTSLSSKRSVVFTEPVVSREVRFDSTKSNLVICDHFGEQAKAKPERKLPVARLDFDSVDDNSNQGIEDATDSESEIRCQRRKQLCHQNSTFEDCDNFVIKPPTLDLEAEKPNSFYTPLGQSLMEEEDEEEEVVYFSKSFENVPLVLSDDNGSQQEKVAETSKPEEPSQDPKVDNTELEEVQMTCDEPETQFFSESSNDSYESPEFYTQKFICENNPLPASSDSASSGGTFSGESVEPRTTEETKQSAVSTEPTEQHQEDDPIVMLPMPLSLVKKFYSMLGNFLKSNNESLE